MCIAISHHRQTANADTITIRHKIVTKRVGLVSFYRKIPRKPRDQGIAMSRGSSLKMVLADGKTSFVFKHDVYSFI